MNKSRNKPNEEEGSITPRDRDITFERGTEFVVPYTRANLNKCKCPQCPVQADSNCVKDKLESLKKAMENMPEGEVPNPEDVPGIYCSTGKAGCEDLNPDRKCICYTCDVWNGYNLGTGKPSMYFCQKGRAT